MNPDANAPGHYEVGGSGPLTFDRLRAANVARVHQFPGHTGGENHVGEMLAGWTYNDWMVAVVGEVGELANKLKKLRRGWVRKGDPMPTLGELAEELADAVTYLDLLAVCLDIDLGEAVTRKFNIVSERTGLPQRL